MAVLYTRMFNFSKNYQIVFQCGYSILYVPQQCSILPYAHQHLEDQCSNFRHSKMYLELYPPISNFLYPNFYAHVDDIEF